MNTVILIAIIVVLGGLAYYFYTKSSSSAPSPSQTEGPSTNNNMIGIWQVYQYSANGTTNNNNYTLNFRSDGTITTDVKEFPLINMSWNSNEWTGFSSSTGKKVTFPLIYNNYNNNSIALYTSNKEGAPPFLVLKPTPAPTTPAPTTPAPTTPSPSTPTAPGSTTAPTPSPSPTPVGQFKPTSPPSEQALGVTGRKITLWASVHSQWLIIRRVDIFPDPYSKPYSLVSPSVKITTKTNQYNNADSYYLVDRPMSLGSQDPYICINLGSDLPIYKIVVYNELSGPIDMICGLTLSIEKSDGTQVYLSDPVLCPQIETKSDGSINRGVLCLKNPQIKQNSSGQTIKGPQRIKSEFIDEKETTDNTFSLFSDTGKIIYFPSLISTSIIQKGAMEIFRGVWFSGNGNFLKIRSDGTLTFRENNGPSIPGVYKQFGERAYVVLNPTSTNFLKFSDGWCQSDTKPPISDREIKYSTVELNSEKIIFGNCNTDTTEPPKCSEVGPDVMAYAYRIPPSPFPYISLAYKGVFYYLYTNWSGWYNYYVNETTNANIQNVKLGNGIIIGPYGNEIGSYSVTPRTYPSKNVINWTISPNMPGTLYPNPYIGSWMSNDLSNPVIFTFNTDMTCSDGNETYTYTLSPNSSATFPSINFKNKNGQQFRLDCNYYEDFIKRWTINLINVSLGANELKFNKLLRNPFYGSWTSKTLSKQNKNSIITFTDKGTVTGYGMVNGCMTWIQKLFMCIIMIKINLLIPFQK